MFLWLFRRDQHLAILHIFLHILGDTWKEPMFSGGHAMPILHIPVTHQKELNWKEKVHGDGLCLSFFFLKHGPLYHPILDKLLKCVSGTENESF